MTEPTILVGDIGGTNARLALAGSKSPGYFRHTTFQCADYESVAEAIRHYLDEIDAPAPDVICLAAAGAVVDGRVRFTSNSLSIDERELASQFSGSRVRLLNDFEAIAYAVPLLHEGDCLQVGASKPRPLIEEGSTIGVIGPGTGLGAAGLHYCEGKFTPIVGEIGHTGFAPETPIQIEILSVLRERFDRVSVERLVSGPGLENMYWALSRLRCENRSQLTATEIFTRCTDRSDSLAIEVVSIFFEILGQVAGDLALILGAKDGIFIAGGIVGRYPQLLIDSKFRCSFQYKGRQRAYMEPIPTQLILHPQPGLLGASHYAVKLMGGVLGR